MSSAKDDRAASQGDTHYTHHSTLKESLTTASESSGRGSSPTTLTLDTSQPVCTSDHTDEPCRKLNRLLRINQRKLQLKLALEKCTPALNATQPLVSSAPLTQLTPPPENTETFEFDSQSLI